MSSQVRQRLAAAIHSGDLAPGTPLPAERSLCEEFGVARTSVREAIQGLVIAGFIERRGNRSVVAERLPDLHLSAVPTPEAAVQVLELREVIEPPITQLAARRATPEQRAAIAVIAAQPVSTIVHLHQLELQLHSALAHACANPLLAEVHAKTMALLCGEVLTLIHPSPSSGDAASTFAAVRSECREIADAVMLGDPSRAATAQVAHLAGIRRRMIISV